MATPARTPQVLLCFSFVSPSSDVASESSATLGLMNAMNRTLLRSGALLFLLGLLTGLASAGMPVPRLGLSAHLEGIMNGIFLLGVGALWSQLRLSARARAATQGLLLYGTYANWVATLLSALFGTSRMTPLAGAGHAGSALQEGIVTAVLVSVALTMIAGTVMLVVGLRPGEPTTSPARSG